MKKIRYLFEAFFLKLLFILFKIMSPERASSIGGWIGRSIGPKLAASRKARNNLSQALQDLSEDQKNKIIAEMWENLGRVIAEYPHLEKLSQNNVIVKGEEHVQSITETEENAIFFSAHLANWEINCPAFFLRYNKDIDLTYRAPNNPWVDKMLIKARSLGGRLKGYPKSAESGRAIMQALRNKRCLGILIDQKYNEGMNIPFFGHAAMTNPVFVQLCQKYKCALIPIRNKRINGAHFELTAYPPLKTFEDDGEKRPIEDVIQDAHKLLESWIKEEPGQWLWLHRRWKEF